MVSHISPPHIFPFLACQVLRVILRHNLPHIRQRFHQENIMQVLSQEIGLEYACRNETPAAPSHHASPMTSANLNAGASSARSSSRGSGRKPLPRVRTGSHAAEGAHLELWLGFPKFVAKR